MAKDITEGTVRVAYNNAKGYRQTVIEAYNAAINACNNAGATLDNTLGAIQTCRDTVAETKRKQGFTPEQHIQSSPFYTQKRDLSSMLSRERKSWQEKIAFQDTEIDALETRLTDIEALLAAVAARDAVVARLQHPDTTLDEKIALIAETPFVSYGNQCVALGLSEKIGAQRANDTVYQQAIYEVKFLVAEKLRDDFIAALSDPDPVSNTHSRKQRALFDHQLAAAAHAGSDFSPQNMTAAQTQILTDKQDRIVALVELYTNGQHAAEVVAREATLHAMIAPAQEIFLTRHHGLIAARVAKQEALNNLIDGGALLGSPEREALEQELKSLDRQINVANKLDETLKSIDQRYTTDHTMTLGQYKKQYRELLSGTKPVTIQLERGGVMIEEQANIRDVLCQPHDPNSFNGWVEYLMSCLSKTLGNFFKHESVKNIDQLQTAAANLPAAEPDEP